MFAQKSLSLASLLAITLGTAQANDTTPETAAPAPARESRWLVDIAYASGGDKLADVDLIDHDDDHHREDITAGDGFSLAFGRAFALAEHFSLQASIGYKEDSITAKNGSVGFKRYPVDLLAFYEGESLRFGGGVSYETNVDLSLKYEVAPDFDDARGVVVEAGYRFSEFFIVSLRRTLIEYTANYNYRYYDPYLRRWVSVSGSTDVDGDNWSLRASFQF